DKHVPNMFLSAAMVSDRQIFVDTKQVIVPPVEHFLTVDVKPDREEYQPRDQGTLTVTARDAEGKPAAAEIALGMIDEAVSYIQKDYAADPRQFYYGSKRQQHVQTLSTFQQKAYQKLVEGTDKQLIDNRLVGAKDQPFEKPQLLSELQRGDGGQPQSSLSRRREAAAIITRSGTN